MLDARLRLLAAATLAIAAAAVPTAGATSSTRQVQAADCGAIDAQPGEVSVADMRSATLCLLNIERQKHGRPALRMQPTLGKVATRYSRSMASNDFFSHVSPGGSNLTSRVKRTGYMKRAHSWMLGENLAWGTGKVSSPRTTVDAWMHSAGHRSNILNGKFKEIGIGIAVGTPTKNDSGATYTTDFGRRS
jgi:uncharacterized protein YkwD